MVEYSDKNATNISISKFFKKKRLDSILLAILK